MHALGNHCTVPGYCARVNDKSDPSRVSHVVAVLVADTRVPGHVYHSELFVLYRHDGGIGLHGRLCR